MTKDTKLMTNEPRETIVAIATAIVAQQGSIGIVRLWQLRSQL